MKNKLLLLLAITAAALPASAYDFMADGLFYNIIDDGTSVGVTYENFRFFPPSYTNINDTISIPASVTYNGKTYSVKYIGEYAFYKCNGLTCVTIPNSVTSIGQEAFKETGMYNNAADGVFYVDGWVCGYKGEQPIGDLVLQDDTRGIADYAFAYYESSMTSVAIPNSVKFIGYSAFERCTGLTSITIPSSVISIDNGAFFGTGVYNNAPDGVFYVDGWVCDYKGNKPTGDLVLQSDARGIAAQAFNHCTDLTSVTVPNSVASIGYMAFVDCSELTSMTIGNSVTEIGNSAFKNCSSLTSVTNMATTPQHINVTTFKDVNTSDCKLLVPKQSLGLYSEADIWKEFNPIEPIDMGVTGDLNGDMEVNTGDVSALYKAVLAGDTNSLYDLNGDGSVNTGDVSALYKIILGQ